LAQKALTPGCGARAQRSSDFFLKRMAGRFRSSAIHFNDPIRQIPYRDIGHTFSMGAVHMRVNTHSRWVVFDPRLGWGTSGRLSSAFAIRFSM
jgi:hypothetical protein